MSNIVKVLFRLDSGGRFGLGHFMRSKALADALINNTNNLTMDCTFAVQFLHSKNAVFPHQLSYIKNEQAFIALAKDVQIIIIDHYDYVEDLFYQLSQLPQIKLKKSKLVVLDDEFNRGNLYADLIVNPITKDSHNQPISLVYKNQTPSAKLLLGAKYTLLRDVFQHNKVQAINKRDSIVVTFGGSDVGELTLPVLQAISKSLLSQCPIIVVAGSACKHLDKIKAYCEKHNFEYHYNAKNMLQLFSRAKLAISAAGTTVFELASVGVPSVFAIVATNQLLSVQEQCQYGWCLSVDCTEQNKAQELVLTAEKIIKTNSLESLAKIARSIVDAKGAQRVANAIIQLITPGAQK